MKDQTLGILMVTPVIALFLTIIIYPLIVGTWTSFITDDSSIGLDNYEFIFKKPEFWSSLSRGVIYTVSTVFLQILIGLFGALLLNEEFKGRGIARAIVLFPYVIPTIVTVLIWKVAFDYVFGWVNFGLITFGGTPVPWLASEAFSMPTIVFISVWCYFPFVMLCTLARLQTILPELYDAAKVDGASMWGRFRHVTLPQLRSVLLIVALLRAIWMFNKFDIIWLLTTGGPAGITTTPPILTYLYAFGRLKMGLGAAVSVVMLIILMVAVAFYVIKFKPHRV